MARDSQLDLANSSVAGINGAGHVVGSYVDPVDGQQHGFLWDGTTHDLGLGGARAIADDGWIAGTQGTAFVIDPAKCDDPAKDVR